jgi:hypothetical protein
MGLSSCVPIHIDKVPEIDLTHQWVISSKCIAVEIVKNRALQSVSKVFRNISILTKYQRSI